MTYYCRCWPWSPGWDGVCQVSPLQCSLLPLSILYVLEGSHCVQLTPRQWGLHYLLEGRMATQIIGNFHTQDLSILPPYLFIYISMGSYWYKWMFYFILWLVIQHCMNYFVAQIVPVLLIGNSFRLAPVSLWDTAIIILFLSTSLLTGFTRCSRFILCTPCPSRRISNFSKGADFFYRRMLLERKIWALGVLFAMVCHCIWVFSDRDRKYEPVYYTYL